jgi:hypothetical protein
MEIQLVRESSGENDKKGIGGLTFMLVLMVRRGWAVTTYVRPSKKRPMTKIMSIMLMYLRQPSPN